MGLGANMGDRLANLGAALRELRLLPRTRLLACSPVYLSSPVGNRRQRWFYNAAARLATSIPPESFLGRLLGIERRLGRTRSGKPDGARVIDLDLLMYGARVVLGRGITVPHPRLHERAFALAPCLDLAPAVRHPVLEVPFRELLREARAGVSLKKLARARQLELKRLAGRGRG